MPRNGYSVKAGRIYLVEYGEPVAYRLYRQVVDGGGRGLCISTEHPDLVRSEMGITSGKTVWLSKGGNSEKISPRDLESIRDKILEFIEEYGENGILLLDGLEYLTTTNGFKQTLEFFHDIRGKAVSRGATAILPVSPEALEERQIALLERYSEVMEAVE